MTTALRNQLTRLYATREARLAKMVSRATDLTGCQATVSAAISLASPAERRGWSSLCNRIGHLESDAITGHGAYRNSAADLELTWPAVAQ